MTFNFLFFFLLPIDPAVQVKQISFTCFLPIDKTKMLFTVFPPFSNFISHHQHSHHFIFTNTFPFTFPHFTNIKEENKRKNNSRNDQRNATINTVKEIINKIHLFYFIHSFFLKYIKI